MPLNSIQQFTKTVVNNLDVGANKPLTAWILPPAWDKITGPTCYVWGGKLSEVRQTMPRGQGFKKLTWSIDMWLSYQSIAVADDSDAEVFPGVIDAVMAACRAVTVPQVLTDTKTGVQSQLLLFAENMEVEYPPERTIANQRMLQWGAHIAVGVTEVLQG